MAGSTTRSVAVGVVVDDCRRRRRPAGPFGARWAADETRTCATHDDQTWRRRDGPVSRTHPLTHPDGLTYSPTHRRSHPPTGPVPARPDRYCLRCYLDHQLRRAVHERTILHYTAACLHGRVRPPIFFFATKAEAVCHQLLGLRQDGAAHLHPATPHTSIHWPHSCHDRTAQSHSGPTQSLQRGPCGAGTLMLVVALFICPPPTADQNFHTRVIARQAHPVNLFPC